jgi:hypothetical protein
MKYIKLSRTKFVVAAIVMILMAIAASRQLYLSVVFRNAEGLLDSQGGRYHLWLATGAILLAAIAACLMFLFFMGRGMSKKHDVLLSPLEPLPALINVNLNANSSTLDHFNVISWAQQNPWSVEGQVDDRRPMNGGVGVSPGSASAQRSATRLTHQVMYRKWAGERHD